MCIRDSLQGVREEGDIDAWLSFFLRAVKAQAEDAIGRSRKLVEIRETVREVPVIVAVAGEPQPTPTEARASASVEPLFAKATDEELLSYGVPEDWLRDVRLAADEEALEALAEHLPAEATEALWELATGGTPVMPVHAAEGADPFAHPDAQRRFLLVETEEELQRALDYPWERWMVFLHPAQRELVSKSFNGPARVAGSAGTGKTVVAIHRTAHLAREHPDARLLLTTFNDALAAALRFKLDLLLDGETAVRDGITVQAIDDVALQVYREAFGEPTLAGPDVITELVLDAKIPLDKYARSIQEELNVKTLELVADAVVHMASLPLDANVLFMTVMATKMPFVGRG